MIGGVGSGGQAKRRTGKFLGAFGVPSNPPSTAKRTCKSSSLFDVGIPIFIPPPHSTSPALLHHPSMLSLQVSLAHINAMAQLQSK